MSFNGFDMNKLMQQAKMMQDDMAKKKSELDQKTFEASAGGGAVKIVLKGNYEIVSFKISDEIIKNGDKDMLEDLVISVFKNAVKQIKSASDSSFGGLGNFKDFF